MSKDYSIGQMDSRFGLVHRESVLPSGIGLCHHILLGIPNYCNWLAEELMPPATNTIVAVDVGKLYVPLAS